MLETWLTNYGYPVLLAGTFLEGETVMVLGGVAARMDYLSLDWVIACGLIGSVTGDQLYFFLGRRHGNALLARRPAWQARIHRVLGMLELHQNLLILGFRFLYGLRSITPFAIGMSGVSWLRYTLLNIIGAGIWASVVGLAGYYFGQAVEAVFGDIKHYELELIGSIIAIGAMLWLVHACRRRQAPGARKS
jgi:membrane protein DedA with SNARE-associated domain